MGGCRDVVCGGVIGPVGWSYGPCQSFDNGMVGVDDPASAFLMKDCSVVVV